MSLFDNIVAEANNKIQSYQSEVQKYLQSNVTMPLVKIGALPLTNLTAAQIAQGYRGAPAPIAPPSAEPVEIARGEGFGMKAAIESAGVSVPVLVGVGLLAYLLLKKRG